MSSYGGANIVTDGLTIMLDATNRKSYSGTGTAWINLSNTSQIFNNTYYTYPTFNNSGSLSSFTFVNDGVTINNVYATNVSTATDLRYTRIGAFNLSGYSTSHWNPVIQNQVGNNSDMCLCIIGYSGVRGKIAFHQYTNASGSGTINQDLDVIGNTTIPLGTWTIAAVAVDRVAQTVSLYVNGVLDSITAINPIGNSSLNTVLIGGAATDFYSGGRMFKGQIAAAMHYNRILSPAEILQNYNALKSRYNL